MKSQHIISDEKNEGYGFATPIPFHALTKIEGNPIRHIEQLWDEIHKLKERIAKLEKK
jgi:hypothetical protein